MIRYIESGNIFTLENVSSYAHGCNCAGAMGKGIALQFKKKFPKMYLEYTKLCKEKLFSLGDVFEYNYGSGYVFNLGTQANWRTKADMNAIEESLIKMMRLASQKNITKIALPRIGAGLGGLDWGIIKNMLNKIAENYPNVELIVVENYNEFSTTKIS